jgi:hypothetical protein
MSIIVDTKMIKMGAFTHGLLREFEYDEETFASLEEVLRKIQVLGFHEKLLDYEELFDWRRGGAETYVAAAELVIEQDTDSIKRRKFMAKAIVSMGMPPEVRIKNWMGRYELLKRHGVKVPNIYSHFRGVFYQEYIELSIDEYLSHIGSSSHKRAFFKDNLITIAMILDNLRFYSIAFIGDLRFDCNGNCYIVDVGEDLGGPGQAQEGSSKAFDSALIFLRNISLAKQIGV